MGFTKVLGVPTKTPINLKNTNAMKTLILALISTFSFVTPTTNKFWIGGKVYEIPYNSKENILTINGDFNIRCWLIEDEFLSDDGSDIFVDKYNNYFHLAWTDYGIAIIPLEKCYVEWKSVNQ